MVLLTTIEVKDALGALQTVRKLMLDYQIQFTFGEGWSISVNSRIEYKNKNLKIKKVLQKEGPLNVLIQT